MNEYKVSIVIPCYNVADDVYKAWNSIKKQTYGVDNLQCIFVDDGSTDDGKTKEILHLIEKECPDNVVVIESDENRGPGGAINLGLMYASGIYMQILDADDELVADAVEKLVDIAEKYDTDIIQFNHILVLGDERRENKVSKGNKIINIDCHEKRIGFLNSTIVTYGCTNKFYRLDLIKKTGVHFAEKSVYEEPLFVYPLFLYAQNVYLLEEGLYIYYLHPNSIVTSKIGKRLLDHPKVQLLLLEDCLHRKELYEEYKDVIGCYFLWSYYCETIFFASEHADSFIPLEYFKEMQMICRKLYPDWKKNQQINGKQMIDILNTTDHNYASQEELNDFIHSFS